MRNSFQDTKRIHLISLGCPKNLVDSEVMLANLVQEGYTVCQTPEESEVILVNTCGFIQPAVEEAIEVILSMAKIKELDPSKVLAVTGCLVQRYGEKLKREIPEIDLLIGTEGFTEITDKINQIKHGVDTPYQEITPRFIMQHRTPRLLSTPNFRSYLKISEGCANKCSFCLIPSIRGQLRSRSANDIVDEAQLLGAKGIKELTIIGQDITSYGIDLKNESASLVGLLKALLEKTAIPWIRLLYLYPSKVKDELLELIAREKRILPYLDLPLQHVSPKILKAMNRPSNRKQIDQLLEKIKNKLPHAAIRTTFIVGFPGETESDVKELEDFIKHWKLNHVGIFPYSNEEGCDSEFFADQCPEKVKQERRNRLMAMQAQVSQKINSGYVGKVEDVLVEGVSKETNLLLEGRTRLQAPDIDGCVYINEGNCNPGDFVKVKITEAHTYDLVGRIVA